MKLLQFVFIFIIFNWVPTRTLTAQFFKQQNIATTIEFDLTAESNGVQIIAVPVKMGGYGFGAVDQFFFFIGYEASILSFEGVTPAIASNISATANNGMISLNWSNPASPLNLTNTTVICYLQFSRIGTGNTQLVFYPGSYVRSGQTWLPVQYVDGMVLQTYDLLLEAVPNSGGTVTGSGSYIPGQVVTVGALPSDGFSFVNWKANGEVVSNEPVFLYQMPGSTTLMQANFVPNSYLVNLHADPAQGGMLQGAGAYSFGQLVEVNAEPAIGFDFVHWLKDGIVVSNSPMYQFTMPSGNVDLWAVFEQLTFPVTVVINPADAGQVAGGGSYFYNEPVTLQASANVGFHFTSWQLNGTTVSTNPVYAFNMPPSAQNYLARFAINNYLIEVFSNDTIAGTVSGGGNYYHSAPVTVTAQANDGFEFIAWTVANEVVAYNPIYTFNALQNIQLTAIFQSAQECLIPAALSVVNLGEDRATMRWISPESIESWDLIWGRMGSDTLISYQLIEGISEPSLTIDTLSPQTPYAFSVRANCEGDLKSHWSTLEVFSTYYVGLSGNSPDFKLIIYPNPAKNVVQALNLKCHSVNEVYMYDVSGRRSSVRWDCNDNRITISLAGSSVGLYYLSIVCENTIFNAPLMIIK